MNIFKNIICMAKRFKTATALNLIGLIVSFAACYLFLTQVIYNHSYNTCFRDYDRLYRVEVFSSWNREWTPATPRTLADFLSAMPQIESAGHFLSYSETKIIYKEGVEMDYDFAECDNKALATLGFKTLDGTLEWTDDDRVGLIIPASIAQSYFGETQVAGRYMMRNQDSVIVRGVYADLPENCIIKNHIYVNLLDAGKETPMSFNGYTYVRLSQGVDTLGLGQRICDEYNKTPIIQSQHSGGELDHLRLLPVRETWFSNIGEADKGNRNVDWILQLSCLLVILIAAINFHNFALAESPMRVKNVNTRKVLGSSNLSLRLSLIGETVLTSMVAFLLALGVLYLLAQWPGMTDLVKGSIALSDHLLLIGCLALTALAVGIVAGLYPAYYVTSFPPALVLKGSFGLSPKGLQLRTGLLCLQFVITSIMALYIGILQLQSHFIYHADYGFDKEAILYAKEDNLGDKRELLRTELMQLTGVEEVSFSYMVLGVYDGGTTWGRGNEERYVQFSVHLVDWRYLKTMGIDIIEGRDFNESDENCIIINEAGRRQWDWVEMDKPLVNDFLPVVGVCKNVHGASVRVDNNTRPMAFVIAKDNISWHKHLNNVNIRVAAGIDKIQMRQKIKEVYRKLGARHEPDVEFFDQKLEWAFQEEFLFIRQVIVFSTICLIITLIGVFCMTMFETEYRRKEIGIRKVIGSSTGQILALLSRRYIWLLLGSFVVASPLAWYIGSTWLESFAERTPIYWWLFPLAFLLVSLITLGTIITQSWRAANENPVESVKSE